MTYRGADCTIDYWEANKYVVCFKKHPVGQPLHEAEALRIARWLSTAINELAEIVTETSEEGKQ